jgi:DNA repair exonuclease SbcCD ATPase subunit
MKIVMISIVVLVLATGAHADIVHLKDGSTIEGKVSEEDGKIKIELKQGCVLIARDLVSRVEKMPTKEELLKEKLSNIDGKDAEALKGVAKWCKEVGLYQEARDIEKEAMQIALARKWESVSHTDAKAVFELATWCKIEGYDQDTVEHFLYIVIGIEPDHTRAREMLQHRRFRGEWLPAAEIERIKNSEYEQKMREAGMVKYNGEWLKPDAAAFLAEKERIDSEKKELEQERERLMDIEARLSRDAAETQRERSYLESEMRDFQRDREVIVADRAALAATAVNLADERRYLCDLKSELEALKVDLERQKEEIEKEWQRIRDERQNLRYSLDRIVARRDDGTSRDCCLVAECPKDSRILDQKEHYPRGRQSPAPKTETDSRSGTRR